MSKSKMIAVVATNLGYYDSKVRDSGEKFEVPEELLSPTWMKRVDGKEIVKVKSKFKAPPKALDNQDFKKVEEKQMAEKVAAKADLI